MRWTTVSWVNLILLVVTCTVFAGRVITVDDDGPADFDTIQAAIDDANDSDIVIVQPGTYIGDGNCDIDFLGKVITVRSTDPNDPNIVTSTIIDCNGTIEDRRRGFYFHNGEGNDAVLAGLTITGGYCQADNGGGIYCQSSHPTISACILHQNTTVSYCNIIGCWGGFGGAIFLRDSNAVIADCSISYNSADRGGAIYSERGSPRIVDCTIMNNTSSGIALNSSSAYAERCSVRFNRGYRGAGIDCRAESGGDWSAIVACQIVGNVSTTYGGGIAVRNRGNGLVSVRNCLITDNRSGTHSGGIYASQGSTCAEIIDSTICRNVAAESGGGITCGEDIRIHGCVVSANKSGRNGGGVYSWSKPAFANCLITGNSAASAGGGLYNCDGSIRSCTISGNDAGGIGDGLYRCNGLISNCVIWGNGQSSAEQMHFCSDPVFSCLEGVSTDANTIDADPEFAAPGYWDPNGTPEDANDDFWVCGDYHLKSQAGRWDSNGSIWVQDDVTSPCIDAGNPVSPVGHEPFPNGGVVNIGAYSGTNEASKSWFDAPVCKTIVAGDINGDCTVDFEDFTVLASHWLELHPTASANTIMKDGMECTIEVDRPVYQVGEHVQILFRVTNVTDEVIILSFPSSCQVAFDIWRGTAVVWYYPWTKMSGETSFELSPGEVKEWSTEWNAIDFNGSFSFEPENHIPAVPGIYEIVVRLGCNLLDGDANYAIMTLPIEIIPR